MKKLLLSLTCVLGAFMANAAEVTDVLTVESLQSSPSFSATSTSYAEYAITGESGAEYALQCAHNKGTCLQFRSSNNNSGLVVTKSAGTVSSVTLTWASNTAAARVVKIYSSDAAYTAPSELYSGDAIGELGFSATPNKFDLASPAAFIGLRSNSGALYLEKIEITWSTSGAAPTVERPVISCENNTVTITAAGADAIYYTTDGTAPTAASTKYTAPFAITANTTVKAVAQKGADLSSVATYEAVYEGNYTDFASFISDKATGTVDGPINTIYQNGRYLYLKDSKGGYILCYNSNDIELPAYTNGNLIASVTGSFKSQNGLPEIIPSAVGATSSGAAVQPETVAIEELSLDMLNAYVKIEGVTIKAGSRANNYEITDATGTAVLYNPFNNAQYNTVVEVSEGEGFTITGFVSVYSNTVQITPVEISGGVVMQKVEAPVFEPTGGAVEAGTAVTITCATEGATIFYTTDGTEPTAASFQYTAPVVINEAITLSAIAIKEGMINSDITKANYTIVDPNAKTATFDFTTPETLSPAQTAAEPGEFVSVAGMTFTSDIVTMTIGEAATSNPPRLWTATGASAGAVDFRMYKGDYFLLTVPEGKCMTQIEFTKAGGSFAMTPDGGELTVNGNAATWAPGIDTATGNVAVIKGVKFEATATTRINTITITYGDGSNAVNDILSDDNNAPAVYYNLQGVRVANPTAGNLYIVRQGNKVSKAIVR